MKVFLSDGFENQRLIVIPEEIRQVLRSEQLTKKCYISDIGYFPNASHHKRERPVGTGEYILIFCFRGSGWAVIDGEYTPIKEKEIIIISPKTPHSYGASIDYPWSIYWIHFSGNDLTQLISCGKRTIIKKRLSERKEIEFISFFDQIFSRLANGYEKGNMIILSQMAAYLLSLLFHSWDNNSRSPQKPGEFVERSINFMNANLEKLLSLKQMADNINYSIPHFSARFKEETGYSPVRYHLLLKIQHSCFLLDTSQLGIAEISRKIGYEDPYYFSRLFKKIMKLSPRSYRKIQKG